LRGFRAILEMNKAFKQFESIDSPIEGLSTNAKSRIRSAISENPDL